jgi:hypothetical protein
VTIPITAADPQKVLDTLQGAKQWLLENKWGQHKLFDDVNQPSAACLVGALMIPGGYSVLFDRTPIADDPKSIEAAVRIIHNVIYENGGELIAVSTWNDMNYRKASEVFDILDEAILRAKEDLRAAAAL